MLASFFLLHAAVTATLVTLLRVQAPAYHAIPWIFGAAFAASCVPGLARRMAEGPIGWRLPPVLLYVGVITLASSVEPRASLPVSSDVFHPFEFAGLAFLAQLAAAGGLASRPRPRRMLWVALGCLAVAAADELHQRSVPGRSASAGDLLLDALGIALGTLILAGLARVVRERTGAG